MATESGSAVFEGSCAKQAGRGINRQRAIAKITIARIELFAGSGPASALRNKGVVIDDLELIPRMGRKMNLKGLQRLKPLSFGPRMSRLDRLRKYAFSGLQGLKPLKKKQPLCRA